MLSPTYEPFELEDWPTLPEPFIATSVPCFEVDVVIPVLEDALFLDAA